MLGVEGYYRYVGTFSLQLGDNKVERITLVAFVGVVGMAR